MKTKKKETKTTIFDNKKIEDIRRKTISELNSVYKNTHLSEVYNRVKKCR